MLLLASCKKEVTTESTQPEIEETTPEPEDYYLNFEVDGVAYSYAQNQNGYSCVSYTGGQINESLGNREVETGAGMATSSSADVNGTLFFIENVVSIVSYNSDKNSALNAIILAGNHSYTTPGSGVPGVKFDFFDGTKTWSTTEGPQSGSANFLVQSSVNKSTGQYVQREVIGTFSCTVYDDTGASKQITNGNFKMRFRAP